MISSIRKEKAASFQRTKLSILSKVMLPETFPTIMNSVTSIGTSAFSGCTSLKSIEIPNSVTSIGDSAFSGCINLTSIIIPNSVTSMGDEVFNMCKAITYDEIKNIFP